MSIATKNECELCLSQYPAALASRIGSHRSKNAVGDLLELDSWRRNELTEAVRERNPSYMIKEELEKLMECKLYV